MSLAASAASGVRWSGLSQALRQIVQLGTVVVLARLLAPSDFGLMGMAAVFVSFLGTFGDFGTGSALVREPEPSDRLLSSVFWINLALGLFGASLLAALSPMIAALYREPRLEPLVAVLAVVVAFSSVAVVSSSLLQRSLRFRELALVELAATCLASAAAIAAAALGAGVWSLAAQSITLSVLSSAGIVWFAGWVPRRTIALADLRAIRRFTVNLTGFSVLNFFVRNADDFLVGRFLGAEALGFYSLAYRIMLLPVRSVAGLVGKVTLPVLSRIQDDRPRLRTAYLRVVALIATVSFPIAGLSLATSDLLVASLFGERWAPAAPLIAILGPVGLAQSIGTTVGVLYVITGRTDRMFLWGIGSGVVYVGSFLIGLRGGVTGVAAAYAIASCILAVPGFLIPFALVELRARDLLRAIRAPAAVTALAVATALAARGLVAGSAEVRLEMAAVGAIGLAAYVLGTLVFNRSRIEDLARIVRGRATVRVS